MSHCQIEQPIYHMPRAMNASEQETMPGRFPLVIQLLSMAAFTLAFFGWLNETWLFWFENPIWLNRYTEYAIILAFGIWRITAERNTYTRKRLIILVSVVTAFWWLIPWLSPLYEPYVGFLWAQPVFPSLHVPGTITFFIVLGLVFFFGRRIICGFGCPCVGIRETVGFAFRDRTLRSKWTWRLRHSKWFFFIYYVGVMVVTQFPPNSWTVSFVGGFYLIVAVTYFGTFFIAPIVGNRFYCRYLCPFGATFGVLNHAGFYGIDMDKEKCIDCQRCEQVCDMGIPVWQQGKESGRIMAIEDCMGCARCVVSCPTDALAIKDVRNVFKPALVQNASHLLKQPRPTDPQRQDGSSRPVTERIKDWNNIQQTPTLAFIQTQASRCLDCGLPGCSNACPLNNRIPEWLEQVAHGNIQQAAELAHATSNLPEICGTVCPQHRLCEGACTKAREPGGAVTIGLIENYLVNTAFENNWQPVKVQQRKKQSVAIIGAGPAGLACADELSKAGCQVTVFDKQPIIGGLMTSGIPSFKLDKALITRRHQLLQQQGVDFKLGTEINNERIKQLIETCDALFIGTGSQQSRRLNIAGQNLQGVQDALTYLHQTNLETSELSTSQRNVLVIGGGDSAMDCARSAVRQGAESVTVVYRGEESAMRASPKEIKAAKQEGVRFLFNHTPVEITGDKTVAAIAFECSDKSITTLNCDMAIIAIGQQASPVDWLLSLGIETDNHGFIIIDQDGQTSHANIYA
ncbi:MAG: FAD-dependent oxidoreductase, partial [Gammaproteobacteria bacterium]|nr:FAD-dependent oxidoreductase [Gammaproteobacteria bacterium]